MSYIGRQNLGGAYRQLDDISSGFDGSDTTHTMQVNSANVTVGDVNQIILSLGGVIQKPGTDFTVSGSVLTFTTAPAANTSFFAILLGSDNGGTVTPTDGSVTTSKFESGVAIGATGTANTLAGIPFFSDTTNGSIYTHDVSGTDDSAQYNTAYGVNALAAITTADNNVAIGYEAGLSLTTHNSDVLIGYQAGKALSTGDDGVIAIGYQAGLALTTCSSSVFIGKNAGDGHDTEDHNMGIGRNALTGSVAGGEYNVAIGNYAGDGITSGDNNVILGYNAGANITTASECVAIGTGTLNGSGGSTGINNVVIGHLAGNIITSGDRNVFVGHSAGDAATDAQYNVGVGNDALTSLTSGHSNTAVGLGSHAALTTGDYNIAIGREAADGFDTEDHNLAIGYAALGGSVAGGEFNTAIGNYTLDALTSGDHNIAIGYSAGSAVTTGGENTLMGRSAGAGITIASYNVAIGSEALDAVVVERQNTAVGTYALTAHRTSASSVSDTGNTAVGYSAGAGITTGSGNTLLGANCLDSELVSGSNNIAIGSDNTLNNNGNAHSITIGNGIEGNENRFVFGKSGNLVENTFTANANFAQSSDQRLKTNITDNDLGLDFINELTTKTYNWKASNDLDKDDPQLVKRYNEENQMDTDVLMYGMLAQDVKAAIIKHNHPNFTGWSEDGRGVQNISREMFVIPLIKAVQELSAKVKALEEA